MATKKNVKIKKIDGLTPDIQQEKIDALKKLAPEAFSDGKIDVKKLEKLLGKDTVVEDERYRLDWSGKSAVFDEIAKRSSCTLTLDEKRSSKGYNRSDNVFIEGENMEVLRTLQKAYHGKVKMIYIDPPYNTGKDFVYNDNFRETEEEYCDDVCNIDENGDIKKAYKLNSRDSGRFHSSWLSMMYPRLYLARNLLRDDGVIFISIDDNEIHNLHMMMNEIFGEENFISKFIWHNKRGGGNDSKYIAVEHEYVLMFARSKSNLDDLFHSHTDEYLKRYKEEDGKGKFFWDTFKRKTGKQYYSIECPDGSVLKSDKNGEPLSWLRSEERFKKDLEEGEIRFFENKRTGWSVQFKQRLPDGKKPRSILEDFGTTSSGNAMMIDLFGTDKFFSNPKPVELIQHFADVVTSGDDIVLDFFSGSGTLAQSIAQLNAEDSENRKFVCIQMPERTDETSEAYKVGYKKISDIAIDRIKKAFDKIKEEHPDFKGDLGLRVYKETDSHFPQWHPQSFGSDKALKQAVMDYSKEETVGSERDRATEVLLKLGYSLTTEPTRKVGSLFVSDEIALVLDSKFKSKDLQKVIDEAPKTIVVLEKLFKKDEEKINFGLRCKEAGIILQTV